MSRQTFKPLYEDIRIENGSKQFYFIFQYYKYLVIGLLTGLLYAANPLATLIPLIVIHLADGFIVLFVKPYYLEYS